ncbi:MAG TPA: regulatory protein RecX [Candidatus Dormibacteraeota bacterium]
MRRTTRQPEGTALDTGLRLLGQRAHSRRELALKLARRGFDREAVEAALDRLTELGYLDDAGYAATLVERRSGQRGATAIAAELRDKGVSRELTEAALGELDEDRQLAAAQRLAGRLLASSGDGANAQRVALKLVRRGFSSEVAWAAVRQSNMKDFGG